MINVRERGAVGDGHHDDTEAVLAAFHDSSGDGVYLPKGNYRITRRLALSGRPIRILGEGKSLSIMVWDTAEGGIEFIGSGQSARNITCFEIQDISLMTARPSGGTALRLIWPVMFANPLKKIRIHEVQICGTDSYAHDPATTYWDQGIWITNSGGLDISHVDVIGSALRAHVGILCESPTHAGAIRHFLSNIYVVYFQVGIQWLGHNEGVYFTNFEIVKCETGFHAKSGGPVFSLTNGHLDCYKCGIELVAINEAKLSNLALFHTATINRKWSGNLIDLTDCLRFLISSCTLYGHKADAPRITHQNGLRVSGGGYGIFSSNHIEEVVDSGVTLVNEARYCFIIDNWIENFGQLRYSNQASSTNEYRQLRTAFSEEFDKGRV